MERGSRLSLFLCIMIYISMKIYNPKEDIMKYYAGIGSRKAPENILRLMQKTAAWLEKRDYVLRSGGAQGSDQAFERGVEAKKEIFYAKDATSAAMDVAKNYHPAWNRMGSYAQKLHARNAFQVLGNPLYLKPVDFVICWTPDGCESHASRSIASGGTGTAISIANANDIPVYNLFNDSSVLKLREFFRTIK